jgi:hypothetical protein
MLDHVQTLPQLEAFDAQAYLQEAAALGPAETLAELGGQLDRLRAALDAVDRFAQKAMAIRLNQLSADPLPPQLRTLLKTTVIAYHGQLDLLRGRVASALQRIDPTMASGATERVMDAAERVLSLHATLRGGLLTLAVRVAGERAQAAQKKGRDRTLPERGEWRRALVDLQQVAAHPQRLETGSFAERLKKIPVPEEEPETESTDEKRFSLIEID